MSVLLVGARVMLVAVFGVAGLAKLADLAGSRRAARDFGVPGALASVFGTLLPFGELAVALALSGRASARWGAVAALVLLGGFVAAMAGALAKGSEPDCHCFGRLRSAPAGWSTLIRNVVLGAVAAFVAIGGPGSSLSGWLLGLTGGQRVWVAGGVIVVGQSYLIWRLLRRHGTVLQRLQALEGGAVSPAAGLAVGELAPEVDLPGLGGQRLSLADLLSAGRGVLLVFTDPLCAPCEALLPKLAEWRDRYAERLTVALISRGSAADNEHARAVHGLRHVGLQTDREVDASYGVTATPSALLIAPDGRVAGPLFLGPDEILTGAEDLLAGSTLARSASSDELRPDEAKDLISIRRAEARATSALAATVTAMGAAATVPPAASGASGHAAARHISAELGHLLRKIAPETFEAGHALRSSRITSPGKPVKVPPAALRAWHRRLGHIDHTHAAISRVHGAPAARRAALHALSLLRDACRDTELALTSRSAQQRTHYAKQQRLNDGRLRAALHTLTRTLRKAGATHL